MRPAASACVLRRRSYERSGPGARARCERAERALAKCIAWLLGRDDIAADAYAAARLAARAPLSPVPSVDPGGGDDDARSVASSAASSASSSLFAAAAGLERDRKARRRSSTERGA